ncbi:MAG TPA: restriction endonuclease subunit S [Spirochaetia bacterium]|nr:restriction endonuclease subunit S [Spirochaetia bacterium]
MPIEIIDGDRGVNYPKNSDFKPDGYCLFLSAQNVTRNGFDFSYCSFISKIKDDCLNKGKLVQNDIVLTTRGTVGNIAFFMKESHMKMLESIPAWCYLEQLTINYRFYSYIFL